MIIIMYNHIKEMSETTTNSNLQDIEELLNDV